MPITASAKKAYRQNTKRREVNRNRSAAMKSAVKKFRKLVLAKKMDEATAELPKIYKILDKTAKTGVIKKNAASRLKSRLSALLKPKAK